jgi:ABC-type antimicrobial peptide transport system permease subunit
VQVYSNPNYKETYTQVTAIGKQLLERVGLFAVETSMPIAENLVNLSFVGMFLGVTFKLLIFSLFLLGALMMNNMFRVGIERRNFDFAVLKVMGASRPFIVSNILLSALQYVASANVLAYPLAYAALQLVSSLFQDFFGYRYDITLSIEAVLDGLFIGVLVPLVAAVAPIWDVIRNDLA